MTDTSSEAIDKTRVHQSEAAARRRKARANAERRFQTYGVIAVLIALAALGILIFSIAGAGVTAFWQHSIKLEVQLDEAQIDPEGTRDLDTLRRAPYRTIVRDYIKGMFPEVTERRDVRTLTKLLSTGAVTELREYVLANPDQVGSKVVLHVPVSDDIDMLLKGQIDASLPESDRRVSDQEIAWVRALQDKGLIEREFNRRLFVNSDSREPELAGIWGAVIGSFYTMVVTLALAFPIGVMAAIYLEEFAPKNRFTDFIEVNINNLAAVPSIVFGLLGLAVFLNTWQLPRSAPLVGGMVLALMTFPTIIIASRAALKAVPPSIREGAVGVGASPLQTVFHHVLPLAMPGILTGTIIGMAQALGETAPLLMIGMVAFVADVPQSITEPAAALPVQIYLWADSPERAFVERTSAAIIILLSFLIVMNILAVLLRQRFERRW